MDVRICAILPALFTSGQAVGQEWTVVVLHPTGARSSEAFAVTATHQGGTWSPPAPGSNSPAVIWQGSAASMVELTPGDQGVVRAMHGNVQVGSRQVRGAMWQGTPESEVILDPPSGFASGALGVYGDMQVGTVRVTFPQVISHAALWRGSPESYINLAPAGSLGSACYATDGVLQGGLSRWQVGSTTRSRATIWSGTAESFVVLGPEDETSYVHAMVPGVQVGYILHNTTGYRACVWTGTPESRVEFIPPGGGEARFFGTTGRIHVGDSSISNSGMIRASINFGTPESWLDLHQFLPASYTTFSNANAVHQEGNTLYVVGYASDGATGRREAILWIGPAPQEPCFANCDGSTQLPVLNIDDFTCFINDFAAGQMLPPMQQIEHYANCDGSMIIPVLNVDDFTCFINAFASGCP